MPQTKTNKVFQKLKAEFTDIDRKIVEGDKIVDDKIDVETQERIIRQVNDEYDACIRFNENKRSTALARLKLYVHRV